ncbi:Uncharacterized protein APZ42_002379, partial [Daphnia magna]
GEHYDIGDWLHSYERIGWYNCWGDNELHDHVKLSLSGAALKWYTSRRQRGSCRGNGVISQSMSFRESGPKFWLSIPRVLDLCRRVDPNMGEAVKLGHLWRGLKPSVLKKLWSLKPGTCEEF